VHFSTGAHEDDAPFDLPPEKEAYYSGTSAGEKLKEQMKGMSVKERHEHMRGLRETLNDSVPKPGDFDNPLRKDQPKEPRQPRRRDPQVVARQASRQISSLARRSRGRRR
jgi:hypothetical protein